VYDGDRPKALLIIILIILIIKRTLTAVDPAGMHLSQTVAARSLDQFADSAWPLCGCARWGALEARADGIF